MSSLYISCFLASGRKCLVLNKRLSQIEDTPTIGKYFTNSNTGMKYDRKTPINLFVALYFEANFGSLDTMLKDKYPGISVSEVGVNFITPPEVTETLIKDAYNFGIRNFFCQPETIHGDTLQELRDKHEDVNIIEDNAVEYLYFDFFSDEKNLDTITDEQRKILHGIEWIEDEIFERGKLMK